VSNFFDQFPAVGYICAHRGARSIVPENTWLAMEQARRCGADLWETDVQLSADGELVLFHDTTLERMTDIASHAEFSARQPWNLTDFTVPELASLDLGSRFLQTDPFGTIAAGEISQSLFPEIRNQQIPLLDDILRDCRKNNFPLNLEIKDQTGTPADPQIVSKVIASLDHAQCEDLILISSFNHDYLRQVKQLNPSLSIAALVEDNHPENLLEYLRNLGVDAYHPDQEITSPGQVRDLVAAGMRVNLWTVDDPDRAADYFAAGATFICTDWPQRLVGVGHS